MVDAAREGPYLWRDPLRVLEEKDGAAKWIDFL